MKSHQELVTILKKDERLVVGGQLAKNKVIELALQLDVDLLKLLLTSKSLTKSFFKSAGDILVFDKVKFQSFVSNKQFLPDSFTEYKNKIGLTSDKHYLTDSQEVVLAFPYKDCVLEGGQTKEDARRDEVFWNETLAIDEIDKLLEPKVLTNFKKYDAKGEHNVKEITTDDNLIIKGNNLLVLHSLKKTHKGKVKLIYIDPPYNTETDSFQYNDSFNHSAWLTFMKNRLQVAKTLLTNDGVIFVQCDDNEQAYLKVLMDEIFNRNRFVGTLVWQRAKGGGQAKEIVKGHDYILVYKNFEQNLTLKRDKSVQKKIIEIEGKKYIKNDDFIRKVFGKYTGQTDPNFDRRCFYEELESIKGREKKLEVDEKIKLGEYILEKHSSGNHIICRLEPVDEAYSTFYSLIKNISEDGSPVVQGFLSEVGKNDLNKLGLTDFAYPKPVGLIKTLINSVMMFDETGIVLDFFGGSGTTAQAVLELNKDDEGSRKFIICEQMEYVEKVTVQRVKNVLKELPHKTFVYCELAQANQQFIDRIENAKNTKELLKVWKDMKETAFLSYKVKPSDIDETAKEFGTLSFADQQRLLVSTLDKNLLYVPYSEIDDKTYGISKEVKTLNNKFYDNK